MSCSAKIDQTAVRFDYTGAVQEYVVPKGVKKLAVDCVGGGSNSCGGRVECVLKVKSGQMLYIYVGQASPANAAGWNGGGNYGTARYDGAYGGAGASDIRTTIDELNSRVVVAGGAGGAAQNGAAGGVGGGLVGGTGAAGTLAGGTGGSQTAGGDGNNPGSFGQGGNGVGGGRRSNGGGGGGWYGGGAGYQSGSNGTWGGSGGGGSSYTHPELCTDVVHTQGYTEATGNGWIIITPTK